jgi:hypothetical protein
MKGIIAEFKLYYCKNKQTGSYTYGQTQNIEGSVAFVTHYISEADDQIIF